MTGSKKNVHKIVHQNIDKDYLNNIVFIRTLDMLIDGTIRSTRMDLEQILYAIEFVVEDKKREMQKD